MNTFNLILLLLFALYTNSQAACYVSCSKQGCLNNNALLCTKCDAGTILINQRCAISGSQSEPIRIITPNADNTLDSTALQSQYSNRQQIKCRSTSPGQSGIITFLNITRTRQQVYTFRTQQIFINSPHQFINIKFNAILFNQKTNPSFRVLIIDDADHRIYDNIVRSNQPTFTCTTGTGSRPASNGFYVVISLSTSSQSLLFQITTVQAGDQLGISDFQVFYGNCDVGCAKCQGPAPTQCLACSNLLSYNQIQKSCINCPNRFYSINSICYPCPYNCQTCQLNQSLGVPVCTKCQQSIAPNAKVPQCIVSVFVNQSFGQLRFNDSLGWQSTSVTTGLTTVCGAYSLLGGLPSGLGGSSLLKTYEGLPVHKKIWIKFTLFLIDQVTGSDYKAFVDVDGTRVLNFTTNIDSNIMNTSQCGTQRQQFVNTVLIPDIPHTNTKASISIQGLNNYFGIRDFIIGIVNITNQTNCEQVDSQSQCIRCRKGYAIYSNQENGQICTTCADGFYQVNGTCNICPIYCKTCVASAGSAVCSSCDGPLKFDQKSSTCNDLANNLYTVALSQNWQNQTNQNWQIYPKLQNKGSDFCGPYSILGSTQLRYRQLTMKRSFTKLPNHQGVSLQFYFYQIDDYSPQNTVTFKLGNTVIPYTPSKLGYNICGNSSFDSINKVILNDTAHQGQTLNIQIIGNKAKFGISNLLLFLANCQDCKDNGISYQVESMPVYSVETQAEYYDRGLLTKIIFPQKVQSNTDLKKLFQIKLQNLTDGTKVAQFIQNNTTTKAKGQRDPYQILTADLYANRQLILLQNLIKDQYGKYVLTRLVAPDLIYGFNQLAGGEKLIKNLRLKPVVSEFSRYDNLHLDSNGAVYRADTRNLMNLFRGIAILALFIGVISFLFGLSDLFDDLFVMCQIIFVHVFIQSSWLAPSMKLPVGAMNLVQFMSWLPLQARNGIQKAIIPSNHYQRSPLVYQQYWKDISFARAIYHVVIFLVAMLILYWIIRLIKALRQPSIDNVNNITRQKHRFIQNFYYRYVKHWFVYLDRVVRFTFFTVMWAACLQFIHFYVQPAGFMGWNSALCIVMFVAYILYVFLGFLYLRNQASFTNQSTFKQKFDGIRIKKKSLWYFVFRYLKWLAIAFIIGQLYKVNPLAVLIPLIVIYILDILILIFANPYIEDSGQSQMIVSGCTKSYWKYYRISHIIENVLFIILAIILIIMYARRTTADKGSHMSTGYAFSAFVVMMLINALVRLVWGFIRQFEKCYEEIKGRDQEIKTEEDIDPLKFLDLYRANANNDGLPSNNRGGARRPSIQMGY